MIRPSPIPPPAVSGVAALGGLKLAISVDWVWKVSLGKRILLRFVYPSSSPSRVRVFVDLLHFRKSAFPIGAASSCPLHAFASLRPIFPIKLFSLFRGQRYFSGLPRIRFGPWLPSRGPCGWIGPGKGPITCQYRHYWRTERNINVYDPMRAHPNSCPFLYTPRVRSTVFPTVALKFSSPTNLHFSDSSTPLPFPLLRNTRHSARVSHLAVFIDRRSNLVRNSPPSPPRSRRINVE